MALYHVTRCFSTASCKTLWCAVRFLCFLVLTLTFHDVRGSDDETNPSDGNQSLVVFNFSDNSSDAGLPPVFCVCGRGVSDCIGDTCQSASRSCRMNLWFHADTTRFELMHPACTANSSEPTRQANRGEINGDVIYIEFCFDTSNCNNWTDPTQLIGSFCAYAEYGYLEHEWFQAAWNYCQSIKPMLVGNIGIKEFTALLCIPLVISVIVVCVVLLYTRRMDQCSLAAWKRFLLTFVTPKCQCFHHESRSRSRNSDLSQQQPLFDITSNNVNIVSETNSKQSITDSGFSAQRKKLSDSQSSKTTGQSSLIHSGGAHSTTSSSSNFGANHAIPTFSFAGTRLHSPTSEFHCDTIGEVTNSGSGAGNPSLGRRTMACQIQLGEVIGRGRYGVVHRGEMFCDQVAVKIFQSRDERAWLREKQIYTTHGMQHDHILAFRGADSKDTGISTELWLVTEYHPNGSLYDYLQQRTINIHAAMKLIYSIVAGLSHLHLEVSGTPGKPAIAHRDLKSRNILVKSNHACCLADFGFAVTYSSASDQLEQSPASLQCCVGTRRYMASEILNSTFNTAHFTSFAAADLYATGLVIWEILRRTELDPLLAQADAPELPFMEFGVGIDPSHSEMARVVCIENRRPTIPARFVKPEEILPEEESTRHIAISLGKLVDELWQESPTARPSALQVKKILLRLR